MDKHMFIMSSIGLKSQAQSTP